MLAVTLFCPFIWRKVWGICYFHSVRRFGLLLSACVYASVRVIFCKSWRPWNHRGKICFVALENVHYVFLFIFFQFPMECPQWLLCVFLKSSRIWTFSWQLLLRKHRQKMLAYWEHPVHCDEESVIRRELHNNDVNQGAAQVGFNEMPLSTPGILLAS